MDSLRLLAKARNAVRMLENNECGLDVIQSESAMRTLDYWMNGNSHFTELQARGCIAQMYYYVDDTEKRFGPFIGYEEAKGYYEEVRMVELAVSWLNDEDSNHPTDKIWWYMTCG